LVQRAARGRLAALLASFDEILALEDSDHILRRVVELARERIGLSRVGIFLLDRSRDLMLGSWGSDLQGGLVDEHHVMYAVSDVDREAFRRAREEGAHFTVFEDCPIVEHVGRRTNVCGRGWVAFTPIRTSHTTIGMMFNDEGVAGGPVDETKQAHAAILCSLLATILDPIRTVPGLGSVGAGETPGRRLATAAMAVLSKRPEVSPGKVAHELDVSLRRLARVFRAETGMSLVEYRNRLRLDRFDALVDTGATNLLEVALAAGFGSYAQFHRVFRALRRMTPRDYLHRRS
jgi:AraC-like DNA-binding protein